MEPASLRETLRGVGQQERTGLLAQFSGTPCPSQPPSKVTLSTVVFFPKCLCQLVFLTPTSVLPAELSQGGLFKS